MRPIDADKIPYLHVDGFGVTSYVHRADIEKMPTIDPIRAAGGCYCRECRYSLYSVDYDERWCRRGAGCHEVRADGSGHCDLGKPREALGMGEQLSMLPEEEPDKSCYRCKLFAQLKEPFVRSDGASIYGYCFKFGDKEHNVGMGKGFAVFLPEGECRDFRRRNGR